jgi:hypothetical protein
MYIILEPVFTNENGNRYEPECIMRGSIENLRFIDLMEDVKFLKNDLFHMLRNNKPRGSNLQCVIKGKLKILLKSNKL